MSKLEELIQKYCPDGVEWKTILDVLVQSITDGPHETPSLQESGVPFISVEAIHDGIVDLSKCRGFITKEYDLICAKKYKPQVGDVFMVKSASIGRVAMVTTNDDFNIWSPLAAMRCDTKTMLPRFLFYILQTDRIQKEVVKKASKSSQPNLSMRVLEQFEIPVPPLPVQEEIVRVLDTFTELQAELQAELQKRLQQYNYYRDQLLAGDESFQQCKLIDLLSQPITDGPHTTPQFFQAGVPFVSVEAVWDGRIHFEKKRGYISPDFDKECSKKYKPRRDDVFMVKSGSTTGKVAYVDTDESFNIWSPLAAMRVNDKTSSRYLFHLLQTSRVQEQVVSKSSQGSQPNLSMRVLEQFDVAVPSLTRQLEIVSLLDRFDTLACDLSQGLPAEIEKRRQQYEYYRDTLLSFRRSCS